MSGSDEKALSEEDLAAFLLRIRSRSRRENSRRRGKRDRSNTAAGEGEGSTDRTSGLPPARYSDDCVRAVIAARTSAAYSPERSSDTVAPLAKRRKTTSSGSVDSELTWRGDPTETYSDWKVEITTEGVGPSSTVYTSSTVYNVHKCILVTGTRKSSYFANLFRNASRFQESQNGSSKIELDSTSAEAFPLLLDYLYSTSKKKPSFLKALEPKKAVALHSLADYFEVSLLRADVGMEISNSLKLVNALEYYECATTLHNEILKTEVEKFVRGLMHGITKSSPLLSNIQLWLGVFQLLNNNPSSSSKTSRLSILISTLCQNKVDELDWATFQTLTDASKLPTIDSSVALALCDMEESLQAKLKSTGEDNNDEELSWLQMRCINALAKDPPEDKEELEALLNKRKKSFCVKLCLAQMQMKPPTQRSSREIRVSFNDYVLPLPHSR